MENTQKFNGLAASYAAGRPSYASALIDYLYSMQRFSEDSVIADIASGTGKFSKLLLDQGSSVYCVEPNDDMRHRAVKELSEYKKVHIINGTDAQTTLAENSVDFITVAQAFHWFHVPLFKDECRRILRNKGKVFLIWNWRNMGSEINQSCFEVFQKYCLDFQGFSGGIQKDDERIRQFFDEEYCYEEFDHPLFYTTREAFINRCQSASYSLREDDCRYGQYLAELSALYDRYAVNHVLTIPNKTILYWGIVKN